MPDKQTDFSLPTISVIVVNYNGRDHLDACFRSLYAIAYPKEKLELILVDNCSIDGSQEFMSAHFPGVKIIGNPANYGFARANNIGAAEAVGGYVAFLNNDARVDPSWLYELVSTLRRHPSAACAGSKILSWDGRTVDFVGGYLNFCGFGFQMDYGKPHADGAYGEERYLLFACGASMLIDRQVFLDSGGFDEDYFAFFEDVDLGWRLWLLGHWVVFSPKSIVYHRHHGTAGELSPHRLRTLWERNSIFTIYKNYEQQNLDKVLPIALLLSANRGLRDVQVDPDAFRVASNDDRAGAVKVPKIGLSCLAAMDEFTANLPRLAEKRSWVQSRRRRSDEDVLRLFQRGVDSPVIHTDGFLRAQQTLVEHLGLPAFLRKPPPRVLLISHDVIGENMAGPAIRYWEIAKVLANEFSVTLAGPGRTSLSSPDFQVKGYARSDPNSINPLLSDADIVLAFGFVLHLFPALQTTDKPLIVDVYDPFTLEDLEVYKDRPVADSSQIISIHTAVINNQLRAGDFFICANERQRDYWLGMLTANNRVNPSTYADDKTLARLIDVVPFGLPAARPKHLRQVLKGVHPGIRESDKVVLWGGGIWEWLDPLTLIRAMASIASCRDDIKMFFLGKQHFDPVTVPETGICARTIELSERLGLLGKYVFFNDWTRYDERQNFLLEADIGVSLHPNHVETRFAFRTRMLDYIWAGLPVIASGGDEMSELVERFDLGKVVAFEDVDSVAAAIVDMADTPNLRETRRADFERVARQYTWEAVAAPIVEWCHDPRKAADKAWQAARTSLPSVGPAQPTPMWALPSRAWQALRTTGAGGLVREVRSYVRWRMADMRR
ncbi:MAG: glycosyltransferase [Chloroflexi bacterium]|nr:glycosyltransferase [Chloroflexota bacterium]